MNTPGIDKELQATIRRHFSGHDWQELAQSLGVTLKSVQYNLNPALGRDVTIHFIGLVALFFPAAWNAIQKEFLQ